MWTSIITTGKYKGYDITAMRTHYALLLLLLMLCLYGGGCSKKPSQYLLPQPLQDFEELEVERPLSREEQEKELKTLQNVPGEPYLIVPGDRFDFKVYDNTDLHINGVEVTPDGHISLDLIGPVKVSGMTISEASKMIEKKLSDFIRHPKVTLIPTRVQGAMFTISGKVNRPGIYPIGNNTRLVDAVAVAQGFAHGEFQGDTVDLADLRSAYISRGGKLLPVDFERAITKGDWLHNIPLRHGDYIYIPSTMNASVYVLGEVNRPTYVGFKENMTLVRAVSFAQGLKDTNSEIALIIRGGIKRPKLYKVNIDKVMLGRAIDFPLEPHDIVFIPKGGLSEYNTVIKKLLPTIEFLNLAAGPFGNAGLSINSGN